MLFKIPGEDTRKSDTEKFPVKTSGKAIPEKVIPIKPSYADTRKGDKDKTSGANSR
jgi:hypothetical protein